MNIEETAKKIVSDLFEPSDDIVLKTLELQIQVAMMQAYREGLEEARKTINGDKK